MLFIVRSLTVVISGGFPPLLPDDLDDQRSSPSSSARAGCFRASFVWFRRRSPLAAAAMMARTNLGNWIRATGGNLEAARVDGRAGAPGQDLLLRALRRCWPASAASSRCSASSSPLPSIGDGLELQAVAAAVIGGTALTGGVGTVLGAIVGALLIRVIDNGLVMTQVDANWFKFAVGALTIFAVVANSWLRRAGAAASKVDGLSMDHRPSSNAATCTSGMPACTR